MDTSKLTLTGSHYFGTAADASDKDYFALDTPELRAQLAAEGFQQVWASPDGTGNVQAVYKGQGMHIQAVRDVRAATVIQGLMFSYGFGPLLTNKQWAPRLWRLAYSAYKAGQGNGG